MFTIHKTRDGKFHVCKNGMNWSPYFSDESDAAMFLHRVKYGHGTSMTAVIAADESYKQAHGVTATLPTFAQAGSDWCVTYAVKKRINNTVNPLAFNAVY